MANFYQEVNHIIAYIMIQTFYYIAGKYSFYFILDCS